MQTLSRSVRQGAVGTEPLPPAFRTWSERGMRFRRESVSMIAGIPGSHKTMCWLNAAMNMAVPTLAFSTDSSSETMAARLLGIATRTPTDTTEQWLRLEPDKATRTLARYDFIRWDFSPNPDMDDVWMSTYAYHEAEGRWPEQIVVDIASDIGHDVGDEWASLRDLLRQAKTLARETRAHVLLIHHCTEGSLSKPCPRRRDIHGKVAQIPELIITLGKTEGGELHAACVKNRHAKADKDAEDHFPMQLDAACSFIGDWVNIPRSLAYANGSGWGQEGWE